MALARTPWPRATPMSDCSRHRKMLRPMVGDPTPPLRATARHGHRFSSSIAVLGACLVIVPHAALAATGGGRGARRVVVGTQTLTRCGKAPLGYCGHLFVPLDYRHRAISPRISIRFEWYPVDNGRHAKARGTVLPVEGGPGLSSIGSVSGGYAYMYGRLLRRWNMLAIDLRGTGGSDAINCAPIQHLSAPKPSVWFENATAACAASLNRRWRYKDGARVHASDLFTSAPAAEDVAAVIRALRLPRVDLYGDSYGSWFAQIFASRYPKLLRSLTLDSTYATVNINPWYPSAASSMPHDFDAACARWSSCARAEVGAVGTPWSRIAEVARRLRAHPISGVVPGAYDGRTVRSRMGVVGLVNLVNDAGFDSIVYQQLDAADRALIYDRDPAPLLRLYAQRRAYDENYEVAAKEESEGLYLAVICLDYPQLFKMSDPIGAREREYADAALALPRRTFFPFTTDEWLAMDENTETYDACLKWPRPTDAQAPIAGKPPLLPRSLPVLVLGGEFDTLTPPVDHPRILAYLGGHSRFVLVANSTHVVGEGDTVCGSLLVRAFVERPNALGHLDTSCGARAPAIHSVGVFARTLAQEPPITPAAGRAASQKARKLAAAAIQTAGDAYTRYYAAVGNHDTGLHGGRVAVTKNGQLLTLHRDQLIPGVGVSGTMALSPSKNPIDQFDVLAHLTITGGGRFIARWTIFGSHAVARIHGTVGGRPIAGTAAAP